MRSCAQVGPAGCSCSPERRAAAAAATRSRRPRASRRIDPIALIKVVYGEREREAAGDGWLLVITQQPENITLLAGGEPAQSMKGVQESRALKKRRLFGSSSLRLAVELVFM